MTPSAPTGDEDRLAPPALRGSESALLRALLEVPGLLVLALDLDGRITLFNRACEAATGYRAGELLGTHVWDRLLAPEDVASVRAVFRSLCEGDAPARHENHWLHRDGSRRWIRWANTVVRDARGRVEQVIAVGLDATELRHTREALVESEQRAAVILDTTVDGIIVIDEQGIIESFNQAAERIFGYRAAEITGRNVSTLMPSPYREEHAGYLRRYLETGEKRIIGIGREVTGRRRDGSTFPMDLAVGEVQLAHRRLFTGAVRDITERKQAEQEARRRLDELAHASRLAAMGELASSIAHELNQPLTAIVSFAEACVRLQEAAHTPPEVLHDALGQIAEQGERAAGIIRRLRQFLRKGEVERRAVDVNALVREVLGMLEHELHLSSVRVRLELADDLPRATGDPIQIQQVTLNLVNNALEAMEGIEPADRELVIRTSRDGAGLIEVAVSDRGRGLGETASERLFDTFFTTKPDGMGLGLSISRSIIQAHGGRLWASPELEGATFRFNLPAGEGRQSHR